MKIALFAVLACVCVFAGRGATAYCNDYPDGAYPRIQAGSNLDITNIDKVELLKKLWENTDPAPYFTFRAIQPPDFGSRIDALEAIKKGYIVYYNGRLIKADLSKNVVDFRSYDQESNVRAVAIVNSLQRDYAEDVIPQSRHPRDDDNPYTDDSWGAYGCMHTPNEKVRNNVLPMEAMLWDGDENCEWWTADDGMLHRYIVNCSNHGQKLVHISSAELRLTGSALRDLHDMRDELLYTTGFDMWSNVDQMVRFEALWHIYARCEDFVVSIAKADGFMGIPNCDDNEPCTDDSYDSEHGCVHMLPYPWMC